MNHSKGRITSAEIASLWMQYINGSLGVCINRYMLTHMEDSDIRKVFQQAIRLGEKQLKSVADFFREDQIPLPRGFSEEDVNLAAPQLYSDIFCLNYLHIMCVHAGHGYSVAATTSVRKDIREYFAACSRSSIELYNLTLEVLMSKGLYERPPYINPSQEAEMVESQRFFAGWIGDQRPLNCLEISNITFNLKKSIVAKALIIGFSQAAQADDVRNYFRKAGVVVDAHLRDFSKLMDQDHLPVPSSLDSEVTDSRVPPFSDRLMMYAGGFLMSVAMVYYGTGMASSFRHDLSALYMKAIAGDMKSAKEWADIMVRHQWMEQPPQATNRKALAADPV